MSEQGRMSAEQTPDIEKAIAAAIEARAEEVYPADVFIPPTTEDFAAINDLLQRERGHMLDGVAAECYRRAYRSIAAQLRDGSIDVAPVLAAAVCEAKAAELREAADDLPKRTEGTDRAGTETWRAHDRDVYSLAIEEAQAALRDRADRVAEPQHEPCRCDPAADGPEETCPRHGRPCGEPGCPVLGSPHDDTHPVAEPQHEAATSGKESEDQ